MSIYSKTFQPGYKHIILRNQFNRAIGPITLFIYIDVQDYVKDTDIEWVNAFQNPIQAYARTKDSSIAQNDGAEQQTDSVTDFLLSRVEQHQRLLKALVGTGADEVASDIDDDEEPSSSTEVAGQRSAATSGEKTEARKREISEASSSTDADKRSNTLKANKSTASSAEKTPSPNENRKFLSKNTPKHLRLASRSSSSRDESEQPASSPINKSPLNFVPNFFKRTKESISRDSKKGSKRIEKRSISLDWKAQDDGEAAMTPSQRQRESIPNGTDLQTQSRTNNRAQSNERKFTVLTDLGNRSSTIDTIDVTMPALSSFDDHRKIHKLVKTYAKKYNGWFQPMLGQLGQQESAVPQHLPGPPLLDKERVDILNKFFKEKMFILSQLIEERKKHFVKQIELVFQTEVKELQKANAKARMHELGNITKKSSPLEYKRLGDKYVRNGIELSRRVLNVKRKKLDELNNNVEQLKTELAKSNEEMLAEIERFTENPASC